MQKIFRSTLQRQSRNVPFWQRPDPELGGTAISSNECANSKSYAKCKKEHQKKVYWHSTFGKIEIQEQTYYQPKGGSLLRPFLLFSHIRPRGYSRVLQRAVTDFGSDVAFGQVNKKLQEHYAITVPENGVRTITLNHAKQIKALHDKQLGKQTSPAKACVISETDGSMVPIVKPRNLVEGEK